MHKLATIRQQIQSDTQTQRENCINTRRYGKTVAETHGQWPSEKKINYRLSVSIVRHRCLCLLWSSFWRDFSIDTMPQDPSNSQSVVAALSTRGMRLNMDQGHLIDNWMVKFVVSCYVVSKQVEVSTILVPVESTGPWLASFPVLHYNYHHLQYEKAW